MKARGSSEVESHPLLQHKQQTNENQRNCSVIRLGCNLVIESVLFVCLILDPSRGRGKNLVMVWMRMVSTDSYVWILSPYLVGHGRGYVTRRAGCKVQKPIASQLLWVLPTDKNASCHLLLRCHATLHAALMDRDSTLCEIVNPKLSFLWNFSFFF